MRQRVDNKGKAINLLFSLDRVENSRFEIQAREYLQVIVMGNLRGRLAQRSDNHRLHHIEADGLLKRLDAAIYDQADPLFSQGGESLR